MKCNSKYTPLAFSLLIIGCFFLSLNVTNASYFTSSFLETEIEETIDIEDVSEISKELSFSKAKDGKVGGHAILEHQLTYTDVDFSYTSSIQSATEQQQTVPLFILFCCLKVDC